MKRRIISMFMVLVMLFSFSGTEATAAKKPKLNETEITMKKGDTFKLKVTNAGKKVTWKSSNSAIVSVKNGKLTAKKKGKATITAKTNGATLKCKITVESGSSSSKSSMVWITENGTKYHSKKTCSRMKNPEKVTKEEAKELGYTPCKKCYK